MQLCIIMQCLLQTQTVRSGKLWTSIDCILSLHNYCLNNDCLTAVHKVPEESVVRTGEQVPASLHHFGGLFFFKTGFRRDAYAGFRFALLLLQPLQ